MERLLDIDPTPPRCSACERLFTTLEEARFCILCGRFFCPQHVVVRRGVSTCGGCEQRRATLEQHGVSDADASRIINPLCRDLANTIGSGHEAIVEEAAARIRLFAHDPADFEQKVVDDVQQQLHDCFVDTSWPRCPAHPRHPLWYRAPSWFCDKTGTHVGELGTLSYADGRHDG